MTMEEQQPDIAPVPGAVALEDDETTASYYVRSEWWKADLDYLPLHRFQKHLKSTCLELNGSPPLRRVVDICHEITSFISSDMTREIEMEYAYYYDKDIIQWKDHTLVQTGYLEYLKHLLTKLLRIHVKEPHDDIRQFIVKFHDSWFKKPRYWDDEDLTRLQDIVAQL
jgi:hypothetical protein